MYDAAPQAAPLISSQKWRFLAAAAPTTSPGQPASSAIPSPLSTTVGPASSFDRRIVSAYNTEEKNPHWARAKTDSSAQIGLALPHDRFAAQSNSHIVLFWTCSHPRGMGSFYMAQDGTKEHETFLVIRSPLTVGQGQCIR